MHVTDQTLEHSWGVSDALWTYEEFKMAERGVESSFLLVPLPNPYQMVCVMQVQLGENLGFVQWG